MCSCTKNSIGVPVPNTFPSKLCTKCCGAPNIPKCESDCVVKTLEVAMECGEDVLINDGCTLITETEMVEDRKCISVSDIITTAYNRASDVRNCPREVAERHLDLYNIIAIQLTDEIEGLRRPKTAIVRTCGYCEFGKPPDLKEIISLSNDIANCNTDCQKRRYSYIPVTQFFGSKLINSYTIRGNRIFIKSPVECNCDEGIPNVLLADYFAGVPKAKSIDDCLDLTDEQYLGILYLMIIEFASKLEKPGIQARYEKYYEKFVQSHGSYDEQQLATPEIAGRISTPVNWMAQ